MKYRLENKNEVVLIKVRAKIERQITPPIDSRKLDAKLMVSMVSPPPAENRRKKKVGIKIYPIKIARQNRKRKMQQKVKSKTPPNFTDSKQ